ncbi:hypothetical protein FOPG_19820 [Fusarium oxysporum f. sp. conglutinans race 2 54008]|uniref:Uncharacterized protein n=1 Tax=Fusarium oxysporum f. sp. conglutinans race 2 54008 TaxID=1089457 RepID=X0HRV4_FUSOX|nr:hypothetical protein FOPG_19820 [Fusarium oxysporum f. sp. conglutinans race 2 54008]
MHMFWSVHARRLSNFPRFADLRWSPYYFSIIRQR